MSEILNAFLVQMLSQSERKEREEKLAKRAAEKAKQEQIQALMSAKPLSKEEQER